MKRRSDKEFKFKPMKLIKYNFYFNNNVDFI